MPTIPLKGAHFNLDVSGIGGFFGDQESFAAMASVHLVRGRRWFGWYNSPGSYFVAKRYGLLARGRVWDGLYPGPTCIDPTTMLELDGKEGPRYVGAHSGTRLPKTGHLAYLLSRHCSKLAPDLEIGTPGPSDQYVSVVHLDNCPEFPAGPVIIVSNDRLPFDPVSIIPMMTTIAAAVACAVFADWFSFAVILFGAFANGISCIVIGSGTLEIIQPTPSQGSPAGDGILFNTDGRVVLLKGSEIVVSALIRGRFNLEYASHPDYHDIGVISLILTLQFILQLFIIPQGKLFGQIMFLLTFAVSWLYNAYLASVDREALQKRILVDMLLQKPYIHTVRLPKWTALVTFCVATLQANAHNRVLLDGMIPNDTCVWRIIKDTIDRAVSNNREICQVLEEQELASLNQKERDLLNDMLDQARLGYDAAKRNGVDVNNERDGLADA